MAESGKTCEAAAAIQRMPQIEPAGASATQAARVAAGEAALEPRRPKSEGLASPTLPRQAKAEIEASQRHSGRRSSAPCGRQGIGGKMKRHDMTAEPWHRHQAPRRPQPAPMKPY